MKRMKRVLALVSAVVLTGTLAGSALAFDSGGTPSTTGPDTITWTGQGATDGVLDSTQCDAQNDGYLLWILTTDGGSAHDATLHLGGTGTGDFAADKVSGSTFHFVTPYYTPDGSLTAYADFTVDTTGNGAWNLVISHGCPGERPPAADLVIVKDAAGSYDRTFVWTITKDVDKTYVEIASDGQTATFNYSVTVSHDAGTDSNVTVAGTISVFNPNAGGVDIDGVTDQLSDGTICDVTNGGAQTIPPGFATFAYTCTLAAVPLTDLTNTATVTWSDQDVPDSGHLVGSSASFTTGPIAFAENDIDECVDVVDSYAGTLGTVCVGDANPTTFTYSRTVPAPALGSCVSYDNTATFTTNDTGATDDASQTVEVCRFNAPLTPGYWKNHLTFDSRHPTAPYVAEFLSISLGSYVVDTTSKATSVFNKMNCSKSGDNDAVGCLAGHLLAAKLNVANISNPCINPTIAAADAFLVSVNYVGPSGSYTLTPAQRATAIDLKSTLDKYNNGGGC